jgi:hypothetical protein
MTETEIKTRDYTGVTTAQIVEEMLKENTGRGLCDSGDHYGRNWSRNAGKSLADQPEVTCRWSTWRYEDKPEHVPRPEMLATISLYHWMVGCLEFDAVMQQRLDAYVANEGLEDESWLGIQEMFAEHEHNEGRYEAAPNVINTYNDPDNWDCSQVLQYVQLYLEDSHEPSHLIVSVHGGCDVRGGYTAPKCFKLSREYYEALDLARVQSVGAGEHYWDFQGSRVDCASDDAPTPDPWSVPCSDIEWLELDAALTADERLVAATTKLSALHEVCTIVADNKLYLVYTPEGEDPACEEVTAFSHL